MRDYKTFLTNLGRKNVFMQNKTATISFLGAILFCDNNNYIKNLIAEKEISNFSIDDLKKISIFLPGNYIKKYETGIKNENTISLEENNLFKTYVKAANGKSIYSLKISKNDFLTDNINTELKFDGIIFFGKTYKDSNILENVTEKTVFYPNLIAYYPNKKLTIYSGKDSTIKTVINLEYEISDYKEISSDLRINNSDLHIVNNGTTNKTYGYKTLGTNNNLLISDVKEENLKTYNSFAKLNILSNSDDKTPQISLIYSDESDLSWNGKSLQMKYFKGENGESKFVIDETGNIKGRNYEIGSLNTIIDKNSSSNTFLGSKFTKLKGLTRNNSYINSNNNFFTNSENNVLINSDDNLNYNKKENNFYKNLFLNSNKNIFSNTLKNNIFINSDKNFIYDIKGTSKNTFIGGNNNIIYSNSGTFINIGNNLGYIKGKDNSNNTIMIGEGLISVGNTDQIILGNYNNYNDLEDAYITIGNGYITDNNTLSSLFLEDYKEKDFFERKKLYEDYLLPESKKSIANRKNILSIGKKGRIKINDNINNNYAIYSTKGIKGFNENKFYDIKFEDIWKKLNQQYALDEMQNEIDKLTENVTSILNDNVTFTNVILSGNTNLNKTEYINNFKNNQIINVIYQPTVEKPLASDFINVSAKINNLNKVYKINSFNSKQFIYLKDNVNNITGYSEIKG